MLLPDQDLLVMERDLWLEDKGRVEKVLYYSILPPSMQESWDDRLQEFRANKRIDADEIEVLAVVHLAEQYGKGGRAPIPPKYRVKLEEGYEYQTMYMLFIHNWFLRTPYVESPLTITDKALWRVREELYEVEYMTETSTHKIIGLKTYQPEKTRPVEDTL